MFGKILNELRKSKGFTASQVADALNVQLRTYRNYENGTRSMSPETIVKLADFFNVSTDYLLGRTSNPKPPSRFSGE